MNVVIIVLVVGALAVLIFKRFSNIKNRGIWKKNKKISIRNV